MAIESLSKSVPHDIPEYLQIVLLGAGGAALGAQVAIRKMNPETVGLLAQRVLQAINIKCPDRLKRCYDFSHTAAKWIQSNESTIVPVVGLTAAAYKSSIDCREQKIKEAKAEIETKIKDEKIKELDRKIGYFEEQIRLKEALIEVLSAKGTELKIERSLDKVELPVDYKCLSILRSSTVQAKPKMESRDILQSQVKMRKFLDKLAPCIDPKPLTILEAAFKAAKVQGFSSQEIRIYKEKLKAAGIKLE